MDTMMSRRNALMATAGATAAFGIGKPPALGKLSRIRSLLTGPVTGTPTFLAPTNDTTGNQGSAYSGTGGLFGLAAGQVRLSNFAVNVTSAPFIDFNNVFMDYIEIDHITVTAGTAGMTGPASSRSPDPTAPAGAVPSRPGPFCCPATRTSTFCASNAASR